jgi:small subunit ribosomal protein S9
VTDNATTKAPFHYGTGRRKTAVARVFIKDGSGEIKINGKPLGEYFFTERMRLSAMAPLIQVDMLKKVDIFATIKGGGMTGHAEAFSHGVARALCRMDESLSLMLRKHGFLMRDPRMVERKKYGLHKARRSTQFSKR